VWGGVWVETFQDFSEEWPQRRLRDALCLNKKRTGLNTLAANRVTGGALLTSGELDCQSSLEPALFVGPDRCGPQGNGRYPECKQ
jgi:hypothetical protein